jgi:hypothetical protein
LRIAWHAYVVAPGAAARKSSGNNGAV